jgi:hypothetical protein
MHVFQCVYITCILTCILVSHNKLGFPHFTIPFPIYKNKLLIVNKYSWFALGVIFATKHVVPNNKIKFTSFLPFLPITFPCNSVFYNVKICKIRRNLHCPMASIVTIYNILIHSQKNSRSNLSFTFGPY